MATSSFAVTDLLRIQLFDRLRVRYGERELSRFPNQKSAGLLAFLALHPRGAHTREELMEAFWPEAPADAARGSLSNSLWLLRQAFAELGVPRSVLECSRQTVGLAEGSVVTDVGEFEAAIAAARAAGDGSAKVRSLRRAADLYIGELLRDRHNDWVLPEQRRLAALYHRVIGELCRALLHSGELEAALQYAAAAVRADPLCEEACRRLMELYVAAGQPRAALQQFQGFCRTLRGELNVAPGPELRAFARSLGSPAVGPVTGSPDLFPSPASLPTTADEPGEVLGGAVPLHSSYYLERAVDRQFRDAVARGESVVLLKGPRQTGKTSLLARGLQQARTAGRRVVLTDLQVLSSEQFESLDRTLCAFAESLAVQLGLSVRPRDSWDPDRGPGLSLYHFLQTHVLGALSQPLVWGLDEVDRLFVCPFGSQVFALFRSWHNERALDPAGPWDRLTVAMAYATEAHLFISDLNQSPFNVGRRLELGDFRIEEVGELNQRYRRPLRSEEELNAFFRQVGGHPYLVRLGLSELARSGRSLAEFERSATAEDGPFGEHLRRLITAARRDPGIWEAAISVLRNGSCSDPARFYRMRSAGLLAGVSPASARFRCELYARYFRLHTES